MARTFTDGEEYTKFLKSGGVPSAGDRVGQGGKNYFEIENVKTTPEGVSFITTGPAIIGSTGERQGQGSTAAVYKGKFPTGGAYSDIPVSGVSEQDVLSFLKHNEPTFPGYITPPEGRPVAPVLPGELTKNGQPFMPGQQTVGAVDNTPIIDPRLGTEPIPASEYEAKLAVYKKSQEQPAAPVAPAVAAKPQVLGANMSADGVDRAATPFGVSGYAGFSIVDYLKSVNQPNDYASRAKLAAQFGIQNYTGSGPQNTELLRILRSQQGKSLEQIEAEVKQITEKTKALAGSVTQPSAGGIAGGTPAGGAATPVSTFTPASTPGTTTAPGGTTPGPETAPGGTGGAPGGGTTGGGTPGLTPEQIAAEAEKKRMEEEQRKATEAANAKAQAVFDSLKDSDEVPTRTTSSEALADIEKTLEEEKPAEPKSLVDTFNEKKAALGVEPLENELATLDSEIEAIRANLTVEAERAGERLVSNREIGRRKGTLQAEAERRIALLNIERSAVARQLTNKYNTLETVMSLTQNDFTNASNYFTQNFNRATQLYNLVNQREQQTLTAQQRAQDDARTNLTVIQNLLKDSDVDYASFTPDQKLKVEQLEIQAGYPKGFTAMMDNTDPDKKVQSTSTFTGTDGKQYFNVLLTDGNGKLSVKTIAGDGTVQKADTDQTEGELARKDITDMSAQLDLVKGSDGYISPQDYKKAKESWVRVAGRGAKDFDEAFAIYRNPKNKYYELSY